MKFASRILAATLLFVGAGGAGLASEPATIKPAPAGFDARKENVPHGRVETIEYESKATGGKRQALVYLPPGYDPQAAIQYPVLYLLHGSGDDETSWRKKGSADVILDNLSAEKKIVPMIVVMPNGFAAPPAGADAPPTGATPEEIEREKRRRRNAAFEPDLLENLIPFVESHYAVQAEAARRAIAGLSMGATQSLRIGLKHTDKFAYVGAFSGAVTGGRPEEVIPDANGARELKLLWLSCGDKDAVKNRIADVESLHRKLDENQIPHVYYVEPGGHEWPVWKNDLHLFSQRLFRDARP